MQTFTDEETRSLIAQFEERLKANGEQATLAQRTTSVVDVLGQDRRHWANGLGRLSSTRRAERPTPRTRLAPIAEIVKSPPYFGASADEERVGEVVTRRTHADAATGRADSWAATYFGDPTGDIYGESYVQNATARIYEVVAVPSGCTTLSITASVVLDGVLARFFGPILDPDGTGPQPANTASMGLNCRVDAWSPDWTQPRWGPGTFVAGYGLGLTPVAESVHRTAETALNLNELHPFQLIVVGVGLQSLSIVAPPPASLEPNATAIAQGAWEVPTIRCLFA